MARPRKTEEGSEAILHKKFWIWDAVWEGPREVEIVRRQSGLDGFLCWDSYTAQAQKLQNWAIYKMIEEQK